MNAAILVLLTAATGLLQPPMDEMQPREQAKDAPPAAPAEAARPAAPAKAAKPAPRPAQPPAAPMGGPVIPDDQVRTLVHYDMRGQLIRLDARPEVAALEFLDLDGPRRERVRQIVAAHGAAIDRLLIENIELLADPGEGNEAARAEVGRRAIPALQEKFDQKRADKTARDLLLAPLGEVLSAPEQAQVKALADGYWQAWTDWELRDAKDKSDKARQRTQERLLAALFGEDVRRSYERSLRPYRDKLENIYKTVEPTPEQRTEIRSAILDHLRRSREAGGASDELRAETARRVYEVLTEEQRLKLFEQALTRL